MNTRLSASDIVLTSPPFSLNENFGSLDFVGQYGIPLNLLWLSASLRKTGIKVRLADFSYEKRSIEECAKYLVSLNSDFIGIAVHFTFLVHKSLLLASLIKQLNPQVKIIVGGAHFTALPEETMRACPAIDIGILGEAENTLVEVVNNLKSNATLKGIDGIIFHEGEGLFKSKKRGLIENVDTLAFPCFDMIDLSTYSMPLYKEKRAINVAITTSRGCPFTCSFCDKAILGTKIRPFSISYLSSAIDNLIREFHVDYIDIVDENMCVSKSRFQEICGMMKNKFLAHALTWNCYLRPDSVDPDTGKTLYDSGCRTVFFGVESGSKRMLNVYNKKIDLDTLADKCNIIVNSGITLACSFIIGGPEEDSKSIAETIRLVKKINLSFLLLWYFVPLPGSPIYRDIAKKGRLIGDYAARTGQHISFIPHTLTKEQTEAGYRRIYRAFYFKPSVVMRIVKKYGSKGILRFSQDCLKFLRRFMLGAT